MGRAHDLDRERLIERPRQFARAIQPRLRLADAALLNHQHVALSAEIEIVFVGRSKILCVLQHRLSGAARQEHHGRLGAALTLFLAQPDKADLDQPAVRLFPIFRNEQPAAIALDEIVAGAKHGRRHLHPRIGGERRACGGESQGKNQAGEG